MAEPSETISVGIDLGTSNSCVAIVKDGKVDIIPDEHGRRTMPSMFTHTDDDQTLIGWEAFKQAHMYPHNTVYEAKRLMGQNFNNKEIQKFIAQSVYKIRNDDDIIEICIGDVIYYPHEISGRILAKIKKIAEDYTRKTAKNAVITVPAYFGNSQREATIDAAFLAGFDKVSIINEPTAAALASQHNNPKNEKRNILIYDFGGGTFDVTVAEVEKTNITILATKGDCFLGGTDIDMNVANYIKTNTIKHESNAIMQRRLKNISEDAKKALSWLSNYEIDSFGKTSITITKDVFEDININLFAKTINIAKECVKDASLTIKDIDEVVLIGGSTRIPKVLEMIKEAFDCHIARNINPDEAVAYGAALYASLTFENTKEISVKDVLSLSLGIEGNMGEMHFVLKRNTPIPCEHVKEFFVSSRKFMINIYQGESLFVQNNHLIGQCTIDDMQMSTKISIKFSFDKHATLTVSAKSNIQTELKIDMTKHKLNEEEMNRLITYEKNTEDERKRLRFLEKKQKFEFYCEELKKLLVNHHRRRKIMEQINTFKKKIAKFSPDDINKFDVFMDSLNKLYNKPKRKFF